MRFSKYNFKEIKQIGFGTIIINYIFKNILKINSNFKYTLNYTSRVSDPLNVRIINEAKSNVARISLESSIGIYIQGKNGVNIDSSVYIAAGTKIISSNHNLYDKSKHLHSEPINIFSNVWIGANVVILPGVSIGSNSVIGAGSVLTKSVPKNSIVVGNPGRVIKYLSEKNEESLPYHQL